MTMQFGWLTLALSPAPDQDAVRIDQQIERLSAHFQLLAGDVICSGTPIGNGAYHDLFLKPGDEMVASVTGLGEQRTLCVAP